MYQFEYSTLENMPQLKPLFDNSFISRERKFSLAQSVFRHTSIYKNCVILFLDYPEMKESVHSIGETEFLSLWNQKYPSMNFFTFSKAWLSSSFFPCSLIGSNGSLLILWTK